MNVENDQNRELLSEIVEIANRGVRYKRDYLNSLITVAGVCFGVFVATKSETDCWYLNIMYVVGVWTCALGLGLMVWSAYGFIQANNKKLEKKFSVLFDTDCTITKGSNRKYKLIRGIGIFFFLLSVLVFCVYITIVMCCS